MPAGGASVQGTTSDTNPVSNNSMDTYTFFQKARKLYRCHLDPGNDKICFLKYNGQCRHLTRQEEALWLELIVSDQNSELFLACLIQLELWSFISKDRRAIHYS
jgi:hypothetical protein